MRLEVRTARHGEQPVGQRDRAGRELVDAARGGQGGRRVAEEQSAQVADVELELGAALDPFGVHPVGVGTHGEDTLGVPERIADPEAQLEAGRTGERPVAARAQHGHGVEDASPEVVVDLRRAHDALVDEGVLQRSVERRRLERRGGRQVDGGEVLPEPAVRVVAARDELVHLEFARLELALGRVGDVTVDRAGVVEVHGGARGAQFVLFKETLSEVRLYARNKSAYERAGLRDLSLSRADLEALIPVANGTMPLIVTVHRASDIQQVLRLAREEGIKLILDGAEEGWLVAGDIAAAGVPVLLNPISNLPSDFEMRAARAENAAALNAAGVLIAIKGNEGSTHRAREARYNAGNAVSHGLPYGAAIAALTVNPARIFGMAGQFGQIAPGAAGDVVVWSGDPLEPLSQPSAVFVNGVEQPLTSRPLMLRDRYRQQTPMPPAYRN